VAAVELALRMGVTIGALIAALTDLRSRRIPNWLTLPAIGIIGAVRWLQGQGESALIGAAVAGGIFLLPVFWVGPERAGAGDFKWGIALGLLAGFPRVMDLLLIAFGLTAAAGLLLWAVGRLPADRTLPMAPGLAVGALWVMWGP